MGGGGIVKGGTERGSAAAGEPAKQGGRWWFREGMEGEREVGGEGEKGGDYGSEQWGGGIGGARRVRIRGGGGGGIIREGGGGGDGDVAEEKAVKGTWGGGETVDQGG